MYREQKVNAFTWIDLEAPTTDEINHAIKNAHIPLAFAEELLTPVPRAHTDAHHDYVYLAISFPALHRSHESTEQRVDILMSTHSLVTVRREPIDTFIQFNKTFEIIEVTHPDEFLSTTDLCVQILRRLYRSADNELEDIADMLRDIEKNIFSGQERAMLTMLAQVGRTILDIQHTLEPHQDVLHQFLIHIGTLQADKHTPHAIHVEHKYMHLMKQLHRITRIHTELRETNNSLLSDKQNEIMKTFTILAFLTFPLTLIAGIFGMNTQNMPIVGSRLDFWIVVGLMVGMSIAMFVYFKHKRWL